MHAADVFSGKNLPLLDANNGGSAAEIAGTLEKAAAGVKNIDTVITGHSTQMTVADMKEYAAFNREFFEAVRAGKRAGKSPEQIVAGWTMPAKYQGYAPVDPGRLKNNVALAYREAK